MRSGWREYHSSKSQSFQALHAGQAEVAVCGVEEDPAAEPGDHGREVHRRPDPVDVHVAHAGVDVVATRAASGRSGTAPGRRSPGGGRPPRSSPPGCSARPRTPTPGGPRASRRCGGAVRQRGRQPALERVGGLDHMVVDRDHGVAHLPGLGLGEEEIVDRHGPEYARGRPARRGGDAAPRDRPRMDTGTNAEKEAACSRWSSSRRSWCWCSASWWRGSSGAMPTSCAPSTSSASASGTPGRGPAPPRRRPGRRLDSRRRRARALGAAPAVAGVTPTRGRPGRGRGQQRPPHAARVPLLGLHQLRRLLGRPAGPGTLHLPDHTRVVIVTKGPDREVPSEVRSRTTGRVPVVMSTDAWVDYQVPGSPFFVLVDGATGARSGRGWPATSGSWPSWSGGPSTTGGRSTPGAGRGEGVAWTARRARRRPTRCCAAAGILPG